jgi:Janus/Ocnus family (Ocnus)
MNNYEYTTNDEDKAEALRLKKELKKSPTEKGIKAGDRFEPINPVKIAKGANKYVLIKAREPNSREDTYFVTSKDSAHYHRNVATPFIHDLQAHGYESIEILGGGRILLDEDSKKVDIFGFSYSFGQPDHEISKRVIQSDMRYENFEISTSNEGY